MKLGIFQKILLAMLTVAVGPLGAIWYIDQRNSTEQLANAIDQRLSDVSDKLVTQVNSWTAMNLKVLNQNAALADMTSMDPNKQNPILASIVKEYPWVLRLFTTALDGKTLGKSDDAAVIDYSDRIYFKQVMKGEPMGKQVIISRVTGKPAVVLSTPIRKPDAAAGTSHLIGMIAMTLHITDISDVVTNLRVGSTGFAFVLDEDGKVVAHRKQEFATKSADFSKHPAFLGWRDKGRQRLEYEDAGHKVIAYVEKTAPGWLLVTQQDYDEAFAPLREANRQALLLLLVTVLSVTLIAYLLAQRLATPIRNLTRISDDISRGRVVMKIAEVNRSDEIGALAAAIDRMGVSIRLAMERLKARAS